MTADAGLTPPDDPVEALRRAYHYGPTGPVSAVYAWLDLIKAGDFASAWTRMDDNLRLCRAQAWLWANRKHEDIASRNLEQEARHLVELPSRSAFWSDFAATELDQLYESWERFLDANEDGTLGAASHSRVMGPELEIVVLQDTGTQGTVIYDQDTLILDAFVFTLRLADGGWKVAAYGDFIPTPGWPPEFERPAGS